MKILYLTNSFPGPDSITGTYNLNRANELVKKGINLKIVKFNNILKINGIKLWRNYYINNLSWNNKKFNTQITEKVLFINYLKIPKTKIYFGLFKRINKITEKFSIDLIHTHFADQGFVAYKLKQKYGIPYVITAHGSDIHTTPIQYPNLKNEIIKILEYADSVIFVSNFLFKMALKLGYSGKNAIIIPNGINCELFYLNKIQTSSKTVGFIGNLVNIKRSQWLPQIFYNIQKQNKQINFLVIGGGPNRLSIEENCKKLGLINISFIGEVHQEEIPKYLSRMDILLLMSKKEGWPCIVLEANACGVYVIGSNNGGIPEAIDNFGTIIQDSEDEESTIHEFANKTIAFLKDTIDVNVLSRRAKEFNWSKIIDKEINVYKNIIKNEANY